MIIHIISSRIPSKPLRISNTRITIHDNSLPKDSKKNLQPTNQPTNQPELRFFFLNALTWSPWS